MSRRKESGITLIALIITIIVILILVAVTVRTVKNSGLFDHAKNATNRWAEEQNKEANIGDEVDKILEELGPHNWEKNGDDIYCKHCKTGYVIGEYLNYQPDLTSKEITLTPEETGNEETQTFRQETGKTWQVFGVEDSDKDGKNETLLIKMANPTPEALTFKDEKPYNNANVILNKLCKELYSSKYGEARSINIIDVNNTLEYIPGGGIYYDGTGYKELVGFDVLLKNTPVWETVKNRAVMTPDKVNTEERLGQYKVNGYYYTLEEREGQLVLVNPATNEITNSSPKAKETIFLTPEGTDANYWLSDCTVYVDREAVLFGAGAVTNRIATACNGTYYRAGYHGYDSLSFCPVIPLKGDIPERTVNK